MSTMIQALVTIAGLVPTAGRVGIICKREHKEKYEEYRYKKYKKISSFL